MSSTTKLDARLKNNSLIRHVYFRDAALRLYADPVVNSDDTITLHCWWHNLGVVHTFWLGLPETFTIPLSSFRKGFWEILINPDFEAESVKLAGKYSKSYRAGPWETLKVSSD